ncbi:hypothetical protein MYSTI_07861 [Myxococcus stipitatus DSM 14675]|uniref:Lipoprotein n=1 Tax=Myxococcus stipitatus (strain DSM 14675 / JCM 12634 / Mx s8) TaxID=1278073 RepID=L7UM87_MYXSD|nr:hypothetical protein [Myxococcus stipitatus]AGC49133.1 hypothetical protein MYSTI_07861 [Myxococcus stipitatus DSM 14675]
MKKLLVLSFLAPLSACASTPWAELDANPASPASLRAEEAPRADAVAVLADADPLLAPAGAVPSAVGQGGGHGHHGHHGGGATSEGASGHGGHHMNHGGGANKSAGDHSGHAMPQGGGSVNKSAGDHSGHVMPNGGGAEKKGSSDPAGHGQDAKKTNPHDGHTGHSGGATPAPAHDQHPH